MSTRPSLVPGWLPPRARPSHKEHLPPATTAPVEGKFSPDCQDRACERPQSGQRKRGRSSATPRSLALRCIPDRGPSAAWGLRCPSLAGCSTLLPSAAGPVGSWSLTSGLCGRGKPPRSNGVHMARGGRRGKRLGFHLWYLVTGTSDYGRPKNSPHPFTIPGQILVATAAESRPRRRRRKIMTFKALIPLPALALVAGLTLPAPAAHA